MDGSLGRSGALQPINNTYNVTSDLGRQVGPNLFHSLSQLNLTAGETASFSGPASVHNVIARVTGGSASSIDGTLQCTIASANFYLVNPSGVVFGPNAALDVKGSFAVTTANIVKLADGRKFAVSTNAQESVLTSAAPAAFGFLGSSPPGVTVNGAALVVPDGKSLLAVAGPVQVSAGVLAAPGGRIGVVSTASAGEVSFDPVTLAPAAVSTPVLGAVSADNLSTITTSGPSAGPVAIRCASLALTGNSLIDATTTGAGAGGAVSIDATGDVMVSGSGVNSSTIPGSTGNAGPVTVNAATLELVGGGFLAASTHGTGNGGNIQLAVTGQAMVSGADSTGNDSGVLAAARSGATGNAGNITMTAGSLQVLGGAGFLTGTFGPGRAGDINLSVSGQALISGGDASQNVSGLFAPSLMSGKSGDAGNITLAAGSLQLDGGAQILSSTSGSGKGGAVTVTVSGQATLSGAIATSSDTGIYNFTSAASGAGNGGPITLTAANLQMTGGAQINSKTFGSGNGGDVTVKVSGQTSLSGADAVNGDTSISTLASPGSGGNAGAVTVTAGSVQIQNGAFVASITDGPGHGGNVTVQASGAASLFGADSANKDSGILTVAGAAGSAGSITVSAASLQLQGGAAINSSAFAAGAGGDVHVTVSGQALITGADAAGSDSGIVATSARGATGNGGGITLTAGSLQLLGGADISSTTFGPGAGGSVTVGVSGQALFSGSDAANNHSGLFAVSNQGATGNAGSITLTAGSVEMDTAAQISSSTFGSAGAGSVTLTTGSLQLLTGAEILSASSGSGRGGDVTMSVSGQALLDDRGFSDFATGISADSAGSTGPAGSVSLTAGSLQILNGAKVSSSTFGPGNGGNVTVAVAGDAVFSGADAMINASGVFASSNMTGAGGEAGNVTVTAGSLQLLSGAQVSSNTLGSGNGGNVNVAVSGAALFSGANAAASPSGVFARAQAAGNAGRVTVTADSLQALAGAEISSSTFGSGRGGDVTVFVSGPAVLSGFSSEGIGSGVYANSQGPGDAGQISVTADSLLLSNRGVVTCGAFDAGNGGSINVTARSIRIAGGALSAATFDTAAGAGNAGAISVNARSLNISGNGAISTETQGPGSAGSITVNARTIDVAGRLATIDSSSTGSGPANSVAIHAASSLLLNRGSLIVDAGSAQGGDLIVTGADLTFNGGSLRASSGAGFGGGTVSLKATGSILLLGTRILAFGGGNGGDITIDPALVTLDRAVLNANGGVNGGNITIHPEFLLNSDSILTATGRTGVAGNVGLTPPDEALAGSLVTLPGSLALPGAHLVPQCGQMLDTTDASSFIVTGAGGAPPEPGGWVPSTPIQGNRGTRP